MRQDLGKGVISCKSQILVLYITQNFEAVVATDLKLAINILTSFCYQR